MCVYAGDTDKHMCRQFNHRTVPRVASAGEASSPGGAKSESTAAFHGQRSRAVEGAGRRVLPLLQVNCWIAGLLTVSRGGVSYLDVREPRLEARPRVLSSIIRPLIVNSVRL